MQISRWTSFDTYKPVNDNIYDLWVFCNYKTMQKLNAPSRLSYPVDEDYYEVRLTNYRFYNNVFVSTETLKELPSVHISHIRRSILDCPY
jgi:hypothetical protein